MRFSSYYGNQQFLIQKQKKREAVFLRPFLSLHPNHPTCIWRKINQSILTDLLPAAYNFGESPSEPLLKIRLSLCKTKLRFEGLPKASEVSSVLNSPIVCCKSAVDFAQICEGCHGRLQFPMPKVLRKSRLLFAMSKITFFNNILFKTALYYWLETVEAMVFVVEFFSHGNW